MHNCPTCQTKVTSTRVQTVYGSSFDDARINTIHHYHCAACRTNYQFSIENQKVSFSSFQCIYKGTCYFIEVNFEIPHFQLYIRTGKPTFLTKTLVNLDYIPDIHARNIYRKMPTLLTFS